MNKSNLHRIVCLLLVLVMTFGLVACGGNTAPAATEAPKTETPAAPEAPAATEAPKAEEPRAERVLRMDGMANSGYPSPFTSSAKGAGYVIVQYIFDTLVWKDENGFFNYLAEDYTVSDDNLTYTFKLREGVLWNDGKPFTAEDVKFSFDYYALHPYSWVNTQKVKEARVVDELTVEIELKDIYVPFIADIASNLPIIPKHVYENVEDPTTFTEPAAFTGTGPMMLESYSSDTVIYTYVKNPNYFFGDVQIDRLIISLYDDPKTALLNGDVDVATTANYKQAKSLENEPNMTVLEGQSLWVCRLFFNFDDPALATKEVRQAFAYAIDRNELLQKAFKGAGLAGTAGFVHPDSNWYNPNIPAYDKNVDKAKQLLISAGAVDSNNDGVLEFQGKPMSYELMISANDEAMGEMLKAYMGAVGIELNVKAVDDNTVKQTYQEGNFQLIANGHGSFGGDPKYMAMLATNTAGAAKITVQGGNRWQSEEYDTTFAASLKELDQAKREALVDKLQEIVAEDVPTLPLYYKSNAAAFNNSVFDGFYYTKDGISSGIPYLYNKIILATGTWNKD